jgi:hypothetical protein
MDWSEIKEIKRSRGGDRRTKTINQSSYIVDGNSPTFIGYKRGDRKPRKISNIVMNMTDEMEGIIKTSIS